MKTEMNFLPSTKKKQKKKRALRQVEYRILVEK